MTDASTVLYVDPDATTRERAVSTLEDGGFRVLPVPDSTACLKRLETAAVDCLVIADAADVNSNALLRRVTAATPHTPVLIVGTPQVPILPRRPDDPAIGIVPTTADIVDAVETAIRRHDLSATLERYRDLERALLTIARAATDAPERDHIEQLVYDHLTGIGLYDVVLVAAVDAQSGTIDVSYPFNGSYPAGEIPLTAGALTPAAVRNAVTDGAVVVSKAGSARPTRSDDPHRPSLTVAAVPLGTAGPVDTVAVLVTTRPDAFDETERALLADLGQLLSVTHATADSSEESAEFAEVIVHELMNPLTVARLRVETAREHEDLTELNRIEEALERIEHVLRDELALLRNADVGETRIDELRTAATEAWEGVPTEDARLVIEDSVPVDANHRLLGQLLANLFENAITHGGTDVTVRVGTLSDGFYVADDGRGIPAAGRERVFDEGYSTAAGTGLGLTVVERIATAHGWTVSVTDSDDGGARVDVRGVTIDASP